jgi:L1 cell adhesion molecule like protein
MFAQPKLCGIDVSMTGLKTFSLSELYAAINDKNIIGTGSSCKVYKVLTKI